MGHKKHQPGFGPASKGFLPILNWGVWNGLSLRSFKCRHQLHEAAVLRWTCLKKVCAEKVYFESISPSWCGCTKSAECLPDRLILHRRKRSFRLGWKSVWYVELVQNPNRLPTSKKMAEVTNNKSHWAQPTPPNRRIFFCQRTYQERSLTSPSSDVPRSWEVV